MRRAIKTSVVIGVFACVWAMAAIPCLGETFTNASFSSADAWVNEQAPDANAGGITAVLRYSRAHTDATTELASVVKFDTSYLPFDASVQSATLSIYKYTYVNHESDPNSNGTIQVDVAALLLSWNVLEVTANQNKVGSTWNLPLARAITNVYVYDGAADRGPVEGSVTVATTNSQWLTFDVTTSFADQVANDKPYGWILHGDMTGSSTNYDGDIGMRDRGAGPFDNEPTNNWPTLEVIYTSEGSFMTNITIIASDDPNWSPNNMDDWRTTEVEATPSSEFRVNF